MLRCEGNKVNGESAFDFWADWSSMRLYIRKGEPYIMSQEGQVAPQGRQRFKLKIPFSGLISKVLRVIGLIAFLAIILACIGIPRPFVKWITMSDATLTTEPQYIVVLGGGGIPSESGLIRTYFGAVASHEFPEAEVIVSLPTDQDPETSSVGRMRDELVMRGVPTSVVRMEHKALNTHYQSEAIRDMIGLDNLQSPILIVTSPEHMRRSILSFRRAGFHNVGGRSASSVDNEADPGKATLARYGFWNTLITEVSYLREMVALAYYRLRGWA